MSLDHSPPTRSLVAIGNFDGVHLGHQAVLARAASDAHAAGLEPLVLTFEPHPAVVLGRTPPALLTTLGRKIELVRRIDPAIRVVARRFDRRLADSTPAQFVEEVLVGELSVARVIVGRNFRFGKGRAGDLPLLAELGATHGFVAQAAELAGDEQGPFSSTRAREAIARGDCAAVSRVLGRPHALTGRVVRGDERGRTIGFPTANLGDVAEALPPFGVYAVLVDRLDEAGCARALARGVANLGVRPTVGAGPSIEAHLFDFEEDLYGAPLRLHLVERLREEKKFAGLDELKRQIARDADAARALLSGRSPAQTAAGAWY